MSTSKVRIRPRISPSCAGLRMTPEEFDALTDFDERYRYELVRGVLVVTPPPPQPNAAPTTSLVICSGVTRSTTRKVSISMTPCPSTNPAGRRPPPGGPGHLGGAGTSARRGDDVPTIAVEYVSLGKRNWLRDYEEKRSEYRALGVAEYWVIDRFRRTMTVYRNPPRAPAEQVIAEHEVYRTDLLPGFELPLARLMAVADKWPKKRKKRPK